MTLPNDYASGAERRRDVQPRYESLLTTTMLTKNTTELRALVQEHIAADRVTQGVYWDPENDRGCFIGCLNHSENPLSAERRFGLPIMVQRIAENIFEAMPGDEAREFFAALPDAVGCDGKDLSRIGWQFLAAELRAMPTTSAEIQAVIDPVIAGLELLAAGQEWAAWAARAAGAASDANAAASAAAGAASAAGAARAANAAARAAGAASAARAAAWAARRRQRNLLLRLIAEAPVVGVGEARQ